MEKRNNTGTGKIDASQRKHMFGLAKELGKDIDDIRAIAKDVSGKPSISGLKYLQANEVIRRLGGAMGQKKKTPAGAPRWPKDVNWLISSGQRVIILQLLGELKWSFKAFQNWIPKQFPFSYPGNKYQASQVINRLIAVRKSDLNRKKIDNL